MRPPRGGGSYRGRGGRDGGGGGRYGGYGDVGVRTSQCSQVATFLHACEGDAVTKLSIEKVPKFNAPIYLQNKTKIGQVDEIFGPINEYLFSFKMMEGIVATSFTQGDKFFIDPDRLLSLARFLPQPKGQAQSGGHGRGGMSGSIRSGCGSGSSRGRGALRGCGRGYPSRGGSRGSYRGRGRR